MGANGSSWESRTLAMHGSPWSLPADAGTDSITLANNVAAARESFISRFPLGPVSGANKRAVASARLLAARTKIKMHIRAAQIAGIGVLRRVSFSDPQNEETRRNSAGSREDAQKNFGRSRMNYSRIRLRVFQAKKTKAAISPAAISIQYWPSKPRNTKRLMRNCTVPVPNFWAE